MAVSKSKEIKKTAFKYNEDITLAELEQYIISTYSKHYTAEDGDIQLMDLFFADGDALVFCKTNIMKYIQRFGKKDGANKHDLLKALHYLVLMVHAVERQKPKF